MSNKNARVIIPLAVGVWLLGILAFAAGLPSAVEAALTVALIGVMFFVVPVLVFYLIAETGWSALSRQFRAREPYGGQWVTCPTGMMALVSVHSEEFQRSKARFASVLRVGTTDGALYLSTLFTRIPVMSLFFPVVAVPWRDVTRATRYEAPGWVSARSSPGAVSATYDPNYTGEFVELEIGEPRVFIQLPLAILGEGASKLPLGPAS